MRVGRLHVWDSRILLQRLSSHSVGHLIASSHFDLFVLSTIVDDLLPSIQRVDILPLLCLDCFSIELCELWSCQGDNLVAILGCQLDNWIP